MIKKLLSTVAAFTFAGAVSFAANIPLVTGPQDPSTLTAIINTLIQSINSGVAGLIGVQTTAVGTVATTSDQVLQSLTIPANQLTAAGQSFRARCFGKTAANTNGKTVRLIVSATPAATATGAIISSTASNMNNDDWELELLVTYTASATSSSWMGRGGVGTSTVGNPSSTLVSPQVASSTALDFRTALTVSCNGVNTGSGAAQSVGSIGDISATELIVEQIK